MGIDCSHFQGTIDWSAVCAAGHSFAFAKATEGTTYVDPTFANNIAGMKAAGMFAGAYHFFHVDVDPAAQATHFLNTVSGQSLDLPLVIDLEDRPGLASIGNAAMLANVTAFIQSVESQTNGRKMIIYGSSDYLSLLNGDFSGHPLWLAQYTSDPQPHTLPTGWAAWTFWQYTSSGSVAGASGSVDLDNFAGSASDLQTWIANN